MSEEKTAEEPKEIVIEEQPIPEELSVEGLSEDEIVKAKEYGLIKDKEPEKEEKEEEPAEEKEPEKKEETNSFEPEDYDTFEKQHDLYQHSPELFHKLPRAIKNSYHNAKGLYKRMKDAEEKLKDKEVKNGYEKIQEFGAKTQLERIKARLKNPENLTIEELQGLVGTEEPEADNKPLTKKDLEAIEAEKAKNQEKEQEALKEQRERVAAKVLQAEAFGVANISRLSDGKYDNFKEVIDLAEEVAKVKPRYFKQISDAFSDENVGEEDAVDIILDIAKLNPKWGEAKPAGDNGKTVDRMVKNAEKQNTSASLSGGKGGRVVTVDDLTPEDAAKLTQKQWNALPDNVRKRLMSQI